MQTKIRRLTAQRLIRVLTVCLQIVLLKFKKEKYHTTTLKRKMIGPVDTSRNFGLIALYDFARHSTLPSENRK